MSPSIDQHPRNHYQCFKMGGALSSDRHRSSGHRSSGHRSSHHHRPRHRSSRHQSSRHHSSRHPRRSSESGRRVSIREDSPDPQPSRHRRHRRSNHEPSSRPSNDENRPSGRRGRQPGPAPRLPAGENPRVCGHCNGLLNESAFSCSCVQQPSGNRHGGTRPSRNQQRSDPRQQSPAGSDTPSTAGNEWQHTAPYSNPTQSATADYTRSFPTYYSGYPPQQTPSSGYAQPATSGYMRSFQ